MKKFDFMRILIVLFVCLFPRSVFGVTIEVSTEGTLEQVIDNSDEPSFAELKIIGRLNADDIVYLRTGTGRISTVEVLDLSEVSIVGGGGAYATVKYSKTDDTMDNYTFTFYSSEDNRKEVEVVSNMLGGNNYKITYYSNNLAGAFSNMKYKKVVMPKNVQEIGVMTFFQCTKLTSVELETPVEVIEDRAFESCISLTNIDLSNVKQMGSSAFAGCEVLGSASDGFIDLSSLDAIPDEAFGNTVWDYRTRKCNSIKHVQFSNQLKSIGAKAFYNCEYLEDANLPEGLVSIGEMAFASCTSLAMVNFPSTVQDVDYDTFYDTPWLNNLAADNGIIYLNNIAIRYVQRESSDFAITIREGITTIARKFMNNLSSPYLTSVTLPSSIKKIGAMAFYDCSKLSSIVLPEGLEEIENSNSCEGAFGRTGLTNVTFPSTLKLIGSYSFEGCTSLQNFVLPNQLEEIGDGAFYNCSQITSIAFPKSLLKIGSTAFAGCSSLSGEVTIPQGVKELGYRIFCDANLFRIIYLAENAVNTYDTGGKPEIFAEIFSAERVTIGSQVRTLPVGFVANSNLLRKVTFEERTDDSELTIENYCFYNSPNLTSVTLPKGRIVIGDGAFQNYSLQTIDILGKVVSVGEGAFRNSSIAEIAFSDGLETIGDYAFCGCENLTSIHLSNSVVYIGERAFYGCKNLETIDLPDNLQFLGESAFYESGLKHIYIPGSLNKIMNATFVNCEKLASVELAEGLEVIGTSAFAGCSALEGIVIPEGVKEIEDDPVYGGYAFYRCNSLKHVTLPSTLQLLGSSTFSSCGLKTITSYMSEPIDIEENVFDYWDYRNARLIVPTGTKTVYQTKDIWKNFQNIEEMPSSTDLITMRNLTLAAGRSARVSIVLKNEVTDYTAYQFDLVLPNGFEIAQTSDGKFDVAIGDRYEDGSHSLVVEKTSGNKYRFVCVSTTNAVITGTDGPLLSLTISAKGTISEGDYLARIENIIISRTNEDKYVLKSCDVTLTILGVDYLYGDANGDGTVDVVDVVAIINYILNNPTDTFVFDAADLNGDGEVDVFDVTKLIEVILSNTTSARAAIVEDSTLESIHMSTEGNSILLGVDNAERFTAFQFDVEVSDGMEITGVDMAGTSNHQLMFAKSGENTYTVLGLSLNNEPLSVRNDRLINVHLSGKSSGEVCVSDIQFVTTNEETVRFIGGTSSVITGILNVNSVQSNKDTYDLYGRKVQYDRNQLKHGVYIINGKKEVIK